MVATDYEDKTTHSVSRERKEIKQGTNTGSRIYGKTIDYTTSVR